MTEPDPTRRDGLGTTFAPWLTMLGRRRGRLIVGACLMALTLLSAIGLLALSGWFITASALTGIALAAGLSARLDVYVPGGGIRAFAVTRTLSRYLERLYNHDTVLRLLADLRGRLFGTLAGLDDVALGRRRASDWLHRLTADIDALDALYLRLLAPPAVAALAVSGLAGLVAIWLPTAGALVLLVAGGTGLWLTLGQARLGMAASRRRITDLERLRGRLIEHLQGLAELEAYGSLTSHRRRLDEIDARMQADQRRLGALAALGNALVGLALGTTLVGVLWLAALAHAEAALSGPLMVMMALAVLALNEALAPLPMAFTRLGETRAAAERLNALDDDALHSSPPRPATQALPPGPLCVHLDRVSLCYPGAPMPALAEIDLRLDPGGRLALCGASGAGKSSLAALVAGRLAPSRGRVHLGGIDPRHAHNLADRLGMLTQRIDLLDDSLAANLALADPAAADARLWRALEVVDLADWAESLPAGLATRVGEAGRRVSGGQARRLALARLWLRDPGLVILDEPFAGLDATTARRVAERLDAWLAGRSVLYMVHRLGEGVDLPGLEGVATLRDGRLAGPIEWLCANGQDLPG
jgi:ATP-binding cassette, subfamily C, bacterial CydC